MFFVFLLQTAAAVRTTGDTPSTRSRTRSQCSIRPCGAIWLFASPHGPPRKCKFSSTCFRHTKPYWLFVLTKMNEISAFFTSIALFFSKQTLGTTSSQGIHCRCDTREPKLGADDKITAYGLFEVCHFSCLLKARLKGCLKYHRTLPNNHSQASQVNNRN